MSSTRLAYHSRRSITLSRSIRCSGSSDSSSSSSSGIIAYIVVMIIKMYSQYL